jgi:hypothetical protein
MRSRAGRHNGPSSRSAFPVFGAGDARTIGRIFALCRALAWKGKGAPAGRGGVQASCGTILAKKMRQAERGGFTFLLQ